MSVEDWDISKHYREGKRYFYSATCKLCGNYFSRIRQDGLEKKKCCRKKDLSEIIPIGTRYNRLENAGVSHKDNGVVYKWLCACGNIINQKGGLVKSGRTKSCGCLRREIVGREQEDHKLSGTKEYKTWLGIRARTSHPFESTKEWYYDKGVKVCDYWNKSFLNFYNDMGKCPDGYSLDRIDPSGDYCKENCRWASLELQSINKGVYKNNTSGYRGVSFDKHTQKYNAYIYYKYVQHNLGFFSTLEEAVEARKLGEKKFWNHITE